MKKTLDKSLKGMTVTREVNGGTQHLFRFDNNFGASVVCHKYSYGGDEGFWELAVLKYDEDGEWSLTYDTPVTQDVVGYLTPKDVEGLLEEIEELTEEEIEEI